MLSCHSTLHRALAGRSALTCASSLLGGYATCCSFALACSGAFACGGFALCCGCDFCRIALRRLTLALEFRQPLFTSSSGSSVEFFCHLLFPLFGFGCDGLSSRRFFLRRLFHGLRGTGGHSLDRPSYRGALLDLLPFFGSRVYVKDRQCSPLWVFMIKTESVASL